MEPLVDQVEVTLPRDITRLDDRDTASPSAQELVRAGSGACEENVLARLTIGGDVAGFADRAVRGARGHRRRRAWSRRIDRAARSSRCSGRPSSSRDVSCPSSSATPLLLVGVAHASPRGIEYSVCSLSRDCRSSSLIRRGGAKTMCDASGCGLSPPSPRSQAPLFDTGPGRLRRPGIELTYVWVSQANSLAHGPPKGAARTTPDRGSRMT